MFRDNIQGPSAAIFSCLSQIHRLIVKRASVQLTCKFVPDILKETSEMPESFFGYKNVNPLFLKYQGLMANEFLPKAKYVFQRRFQDRYI